MHNIKKYATASFVGLKTKQLFATIACLLLMAIFSIPNLQYAFASSCSAKLTAPSLKTTYSPSLAGATTGQQFIITTVITNCLSSDLNLVVLIEARNSKDVTEYLSWQSGTVKANGEMDVGVSWVPLQADNYELRVFAISDLSNPLMLSSIMTSDVTIAESNRSIIKIPYNPDRVQEPTSFDPYLLRVVIGVNNTVTWVNEDTIPHRLAGDNRMPDGIPQPVAFGKPVFLDTGDSVEHTFTEEGLYAYFDPDNPDRQGLIRVFPNSVLNAHIALSINGIKGTYSLESDKQIDYSLDIQGFETGCGTLDVKVMKIDAAPDEFNYSYGIALDCFGYLHYHDFSIHFPMDESDKANYTIPIGVDAGWIRKPGTYQMIVTFQTEGTSLVYTTTKEFTVTQGS